MRTAEAMKNSIPPSLFSSSGLDKVAALMLSLPSEEVGKIFVRLEPSEVKKIAQRMATLESLKQDYIEELCQEFTEKVANVKQFKGATNNSELLLKNIFAPTKDDSITGVIDSPDRKKLWEQLSKVNPSILANFLKSEHPQTIALVMSKIHPQQAASILSLFQQDLALEVINRMLSQGQVQQEILDDVENSLMSQFANTGITDKSVDTYKHIADIFNAFDPITELELFKGLETVNSEATNRIKAMLFTFENLLNIDDEGMQVLLQNISKSKLVIALKGASESLKAHFFKGMSERTGSLLKDELIALDKIKIRNIEEAQQEIIIEAKRLIRKGSIRIQYSSLLK